MITNKRELAKINIASILDWPSVFMGGPSQQNLKRAEKILQFLEDEGMIRISLDSPAESNGAKTMSETDFGSAFITREKDGTVTIEVRAPGARDSSKINMPLANFEALVGLPHIHDVRGHDDR